MPAVPARRHTNEFVPAEASALRHGNPLMGSRWHTVTGVVEQIEGFRDFFARSQPTRIFFEYPEEIGNRRCAVLHLGVWHVTASRERSWVLTEISFPLQRQEIGQDRLGRYPLGGHSTGATRV